MPIEREDLRALRGRDAATTSTPLDVAIIGGGAAGVLVAIHLLRSSGRGTRLCVIEPRESLGEGVAYSTRDPEHLLNVRAADMSAFGDDPGHFVRHLQRSGTTAAPGNGDLAGRFVPRLEYGRYLRATLGEYVASESIHSRDKAIDVTGSGPYTITLASGRTLQARAVVMATGNHPRTLATTRADANPAAIASGWDYRAIAIMPTQADVCIVGAGLSMVDAVVSLGRNRHKGRIRVLSRHGLMPLPHATSRGPAADVEELLALGVRARVRAIRARAEADKRDNAPWQWTMDGLRPHGRRLWQSLDDGEQRRFLRHAQRFWDIHRHRIAPEVALRMETMRQSGQLTVHAGRIASIDAGPAGFALTWRNRGSETTERVQVQRVIACVGIQTRLEEMHDALPTALAARGTIVPGPHGLGLDVDDAGALVRADGTVQPYLHAIGTARLGHDWETVAIPELRVQAAAISGRLIRATSESGVE